MLREDQPRFFKLFKQVNDPSFSEGEELVNGLYKAFQQQVQAGETSLRVFTTKQREHIYGTPEFTARVKGGKGMPTSFFLTGIDPGALAQGSAGNGVIRYQNGGFRELIEFPHPIGWTWAWTKRKYILTNQLCIWYNKGKIHCFPSAEIL